MKKLIVLTLLCTLCFSLPINAKKQIENYSTFKPAWYIGANGGMNMFMGEGNNFLNPNKTFVFSFSQNSSFLGRLSAEYKFSPVFGLRGMLGYHAYKWTTVAPLNADGSFPTFLFGTENLTADFMFNLSNLHGGYRPERKIDFSLFVGLGAAYLHNNMLLVPVAGIGRGGLQADYHLSPALDLNLIVEGNFTTDNYNDLAYMPLPVDAIPALTLGLSYRLPEKKQKSLIGIDIIKEKDQVADKGKKSTADVVKKDTVVSDKIVKIDLTDIIVKKVEDKVVVKTSVKDSTQSLAVADIKKSTTDTIRLNKVEETNLTTTIAGLNEKIYFTINHVEVVEAIHGTTFNQIAEFVKQHPTAIITVSGYADNSSGSVAVNNMMSKQRAVNVANTLIRFYGVDYNNIHVKWYGGGVQPSLIPSKNRLVIVKSPAIKGNAVTQNKTVKTEEAIVATKTVVMAQKVDSTEKIPELFSSVNFSKGTSDIVNSKQQVAIEEIALFLKKYPATRILVSGYADKSTGSVTKNAELAKQRVVAVSNALTQIHKIKADRIQIKWYGVAQSKDATTSMNGIVLIEKIK